jgi:hypothetical protein
VCSSDLLNKTLFPLEPQFNPVTASWRDDRGTVLLRIYPLPDRFFGLHIPDRPILDELEL